MKPKEQQVNESQLTLESLFGQSAEEICMLYRQAGSMFPELETSDDVDLTKEVDLYGFLIGDDLFVPALGLPL